MNIVPKDYQQLFGSESAGDIGLLTQLITNDQRLTAAVKTKFSQIMERATGADATQQLTAHEVDLLQTVLYLTPTLASTTTLLSEILVKQQPWLDYAAAIDTLMDKKVLGPTQYLLHLRHLHRQNDLAVFFDSLRLLGFDLQQDLFEISEVRNNIKTNFFMFSQYYKTASTVDFSRFLVFLLKRNVNIDELWTRSYQKHDMSIVGAIDPQKLLTTAWENFGGSSAPFNFVPNLRASSLVISKESFLAGASRDLYYSGYYAPEVPYATGLAPIYFRVLSKLDYWYKTTHVDVNVDISGLEGELLSSPDTQLLQRIETLLYEFAPITMVIRNLFFAITINFVPLRIELRTAFNLLQYIYIGKNRSALKTIEIAGPDTIVEGKYGFYSLWLVYEDDSRVLAVANLWWTSDATLLQMQPSGLGLAGQVAADTPTTIYAAYYSHTAQKPVTILDVRADYSLLGIAIDGPPVVDEQTQTQYLLVLTWSNGFVQTLDPSHQSANDQVFWGLWNKSRWHNNNILHTIANSGILSTGPMGDLVKFDQVLLKVNFFVGDKILSASYPVLVRNTRANEVVAGLLFYGLPQHIDDINQLPSEPPNRVGEARYHFDLHVGDRLFLHTLAEYNSLRREFVIPIYLLRTNVATIDLATAILTVGYFEQEFVSILDIYYQSMAHEQLFHIVVELHFIPQTIELLGLEVLGLDVVEENQQTYYQARATWENATGGGQTSAIVAAIWEVSSYHIGKFSGLFWPTNVVMESTVTVQATYIDPVAGKRVATKPVLVKRHASKLVRAEIMGPSVLQEGESPQLYRCLLTWDSGITFWAKDIVWHDEPNPACVELVPLTDSLYPTTALPTTDDGTSGSAAADSCTKCTLQLVASPVDPSVLLFAQFVADGIEFLLSKPVFLIPRAMRYRSLRIHGPDVVDELTYTDYEAVLLDVDGNSTPVNPSWSLELYDPNNSPELVDVAKVNSQGGLTAFDVERVTIVRLTARHFGLEDTLLVSIIDRGDIDINTVDCAYIRGANYVCDNTECYGLMIYQNGDITPASMTVQWFINVDDEIAEIDSEGCLTVNRANTVETSVRITALYTCSQLGTNNCESCGFIVPYTLTRSKTVIACGRGLDPIYNSEDDCKDPTPCLYVRIVGPIEVDELTTHDYHLMLYKRDGSIQELLTSDWSVVSSVYATMNLNYMEAMDVPRDVVVKITATYHDYPECGTLSDDLEVKILNKQPQVRKKVYVQISGPTRVPEKTRTAYTLTLYYDDGTTREVTQDPRSVWSTVEHELAASMDQEILVAGDVEIETTVTIYVEYTEDGQVYTDTHVVVIIIDGLLSVEIVGVAEMVEQTCENYYLKAYYANGGGVGVIVPSILHPGSITWSVLTNIQYFTVSKASPTQAILCAGDITRKECTVLSATFTDSDLNQSATDTQDVCATPVQLLKPTYGVGPYQNTANLGELPAYVDKYVYTEITPTTPGCWWEVHHDIPDSPEYPNYYAWMCLPLAFAPTAGGVVAVASKIRDMDSPIWTEEFAGGLEGATWGDGLHGSSYLPVRFTRVIDGVTSDWLLFRSDYRLPRGYFYRYTFYQGFSGLQG